MTRLTDFFFVFFLCINGNGRVFRFDFLHSLLPSVIWCFRFWFQFIYFNINYWKSNENQFKHLIPTFSLYSFQFDDICNKSNYGKHGFISTQLSEQFCKFKSNHSYTLCCRFATDIFFFYLICFPFLERLRVHLKSLSQLQHLNGVLIKWLAAMLVQLRSQYQ